MKMERETVEEMVAFSAESYLAYANRVAERANRTVPFELRYMAGMSRGLDKERAIFEALQYIGQW